MSYRLGIRPTWSIVRRLSVDKQPKRETLVVRDPVTGAEGFCCKLDMRECDHDWPDTNDPDDCSCTKCGTSFWAYAMMECP